MLWWLLFLSVFLAWRVSRRQRAGSPVAITMWFWAFVLLAAILSNLDLAALTVQAATIIALGLASLALPSLIRARPEVTVKFEMPGKATALPKVIVSAAVLLVLVAIGFVAFRSRISGVTGSSFGNLTPSQIRYAQNTAARGGGLAALCGAASPVLACMGIYAGRTYSRAWYVLSVVSVAALLDSPGRTSVLALGITTATFFLYLRRTGAPRTRRRRRRWRIRGLSRGTASAGGRQARAALIIVAAVVIMAYYFNHLGQTTGKNDLTRSAYPSFNGPTWLLSPVLYLTGGIAALSAALTNGYDPFDHPGSTYLFSKLGNIYDPNVHVPNTIAGFINIPAPFNVYTGFGQLYFDWGYGGVAFFCVLLGLIVTEAHRRALTGRISSIWLASLLTNIIISMQLEFRLFLLDVDFQVLLGALVFGWIQRSKPRKRADPMRVARPYIHPPKLRGRAESVRGPAS